MFDDEGAFFVGIPLICLALLLAIAIIREAARTAPPAEAPAIVETAKE